jgi:hypothetical protein
MARQSEKRDNITFITRWIQYTTNPTARMFSLGFMTVEDLNHLKEAAEKAFKLAEAVEEKKAPEGGLRKVNVLVDQTTLRGDYGMIPSIFVTCTRCEKRVEVYGQTEASVRRGCIMLHEQCDEQNFYVYELKDAS